MAEFAIQTESFTIPLDNDLFIRGNVHVPDDHQIRPVLLICHGFKGFKDWGFFPYIAQEISRHGYCVIRFNFSCNGVNEKDFDELEKFAINTYSREQADLKELLNRVKAKELPLSDHFDIQRIAVLGHSRGGGNSIIFASEHPEIKAVVTWNGVSRVDFFDESLKKEIRENGIAYIENARTKQLMPIKSIVLEDIDKHKDRFDILSKLKALTAPVLIVQGTKDYDRLVKGAQLMKEVAPQHQLIMIEGADHTMNAVHPFQGTNPLLEKALQETIDFLGNTL